MIIDKAVVGKYAVNCYMIADDKKAAVIDPGAQANLVERMLDQHQVSLEYIILTHGHGDHIGAVLDLKEKFGAKIIVSEDEDMIAKPEVNHSLEICGKAISIEADLYVRDGDVVELGELKLKCIKTPGHTKGGMCILVDKYLFTGDTLFNRSVGRTDLYGGSMQTLVNSITSKLMILDDETVVFPGHGSKSTIGFERENNPFI